MKSVLRWLAHGILFLPACCGTAQFHLIRVVPVRDIPPTIRTASPLFEGTPGVVVELSANIDLLWRDRGLGVLYDWVELCEDPSISGGHRQGTSLVAHGGLFDAFGNQLGHGRLPARAMPDAQGRFRYFLPIEMVTSQRFQEASGDGAAVQLYAAHDLRRDSRDLCFVVSDHDMLRAPRYSNRVVIPAAAIRAALPAEP